MISILLLLNIAFYMVGGLGYALYFFLVLRNKRTQDYMEEIRKIDCLNQDLPPVAIIVSTFEESAVIRRKIANLATLDYPHEKLNILVIDDNSKDGTADIAEKAIGDYHLNGSVLKNSRRIGLNASLNVAFKTIQDPIICVTDSDVLLERDSLINSICVLQRFENAGGVTGRLVPMSDKMNLTTKSEESYRMFYDSAMLAESSLHSAFPGNGTLLVFKKTSLSSIPEGFGSSDGNIAISIIKGGQRFLYAPNAIVKEPVPDTLSQQRLQKVRRARRLIEVLIHNSDVLFNKRSGAFGKTIFPLKFWMYIMSPISLFLGLVSMILLMILAQNLIFNLISASLLIALCSALFSFKSTRAVFSGFILHNLYLILGLVSLPKRSHLWQKVERNTLSII